jgi:PKD repeat protein
MLRQLITPLHRRIAMAFRTRAVAALSVLAVALLGSVIPSAPASASGVTVVPRPDHVVVLVLENHSITNILNNPDAPYINSLATSGANMTQSFAETHPSQPNYIALFSGSTNGLTDDSCPHTYTTDNLGAQAIAAGIGFVGYSEGLPSVGYTGCTSGRYARKHSPWVNFSNVPAASNQPLTSFPTDYSTLPAISFVIPNLDHDMHDGTIAQGDTWIRDNLDGYVQWAKTHNSVLMLTFDEDDNTPANQIPTVIVGQRVAPGQYSEHINHYNVLRTIQDGFGLPPLGNAATAAPILDIWTPDANAPQAVFTVSCVDLTCSADGSASSATTGSLTAWDWTWGDGAVTSGTTSSHTYAAPGDFTVTLRVTDDSARASQITHPVSPRAPGGANVFASDLFGRTSSSGFGVADIGGPWAVAGSATNYTVSGGAGRVRIVAGSGPNAYLGAVSSTDTDLTADVALDKNGNSGTTQIALVGRGSSSNAYRGKLGISPTGGVTAYLTKVVAGAESTVTQATVTGLTYTAGTTLRMRLQVVGTSPTSLKFKVWKTSDAEPSAWRLSTTDATAATQTAGGIGLWAYASGAVTNGPLTLTVDNVSAKPTAAPPANVPPVARFTSTTAGLTASFNATTSSDSDGTIANYNWNYGDSSTTGSGANPSHPYTTAGTYQVTLTVTDNNGATDTVTHPVTVTAPPQNVPPVARFTSTTADLTASFNATTSSDSDGTIANYSWNYGDSSTTGTGASPSHPYALAGTYQVTLTVTDNNGASDTVTHPVTVTAPPQNVPPVARFTSTTADLTASFNATTSSDSDGSIANYSWNYGDSSTTGTGASPSHPYALAGTYQVTLTVTDNNGATDTVTHPVTVTAPAGNSTFATDTFSRTSLSGFGTSDLGGAWTVAGTATNYTVGGGTGKIRIATAGSGPNAYLASATSTDTDLSADFSLDKAGTGNTGTQVALVGRGTASNAYRGKVAISSTGAVTAYLTKVVAGAESTVLQTPVTGMTYTAGDILHLRMQAIGSGPTSLKFKVWKGSDAEPSAWRLSTTDSTAALQAAGGIGMWTYLSSAATNAPVTVSVDNLSAVHTLN